MKIKIGSGRFTRLTDHQISVDGENISQILKSIKIEMAVDCVTTITLELFGNVEIPEILQGLVIVGQNEDVHN